MAAENRGDGSCGIVSLFPPRSRRRLPERISLAGLFALLTGYLSVLAQLVLYAWSAETDDVKLVAIIFAVFSALPLLDFLSPLLCFMAPKNDTAEHPVHAGSV